MRRSLGIARHNAPALSGARGCRLLIGASMQRHGFHAPVRARGDFRPYLRRAIVQMKKMPPVRPVMTPIGMSSGAMTTRAPASAQIRKTAPA